MMLKYIEGHQSKTKQLFTDMSISTICVDIYFTNIRKEVFIFQHWFVVICKNNKVIIIIVRIMNRQIKP